MQIEISIPEPTDAQKARLFATGQSDAERRAAGWLKAGSLITGTLQPVVCATAVAVALIALGFQVGERLDSFWLVAAPTDVRQLQRDSGSGSPTRDGATAAAPSTTKNNEAASNATNRSGSAESGGTAPSVVTRIPAYLANGAAMPIRWYSSWPFALAILGLAATGLGALRRVPQERVADSAAFAKALSKWHPIVLTEGARNTPRTARRFQNRVRYLAMRQRALENGPQFSLAELWMRRLVGAKIGKPPRLLRLDDQIAEPYDQWEGTREIGLDRPVYIPEETLVALAAIHQFEPEWIMDERLFKKRLVDGGDTTPTAIAAALNELPLSQRSHLRTYRSAYLRLCSEVDEQVLSSGAPSSAEIQPQSAGSRQTSGVELV